MPSRRYVLYWMTAFRRIEDNFALDHAVNLANRLRRPLVIFEPLHCDTPWASDRFHQFVIDGMRATARRLTRSAVSYWPYVEPRAGEGGRLLDVLASQACIVVGDDHPGPVIPSLLSAAARRLDVAFEAVDSCGLLPLRAADRIYVRAFDFRRFLQRQLPQHLLDQPLRRPLARVVVQQCARPPRGVAERWPSIATDTGRIRVPRLAALPIDHTVAAVAESGGSQAAHATLRRFLGERLSRYTAERNFPSVDVTSGLSPYLRFGHIGPHAILRALAKREQWQVSDLSARVTGKVRNFWNMSEESEAFLDQCVTWRELGFNMAWQRSDTASYAAQPEWARRTLEKHRTDPRSPSYSLTQLAAAETHDELWNAAQRQLLAEGRIHNALRMLWGKKVLQWTPEPELAFETLVNLNDRYAVDGRDPNSYSGVGWCLGRYDRAWGPERPVFGTVRYMSSENSRRKWKTTGYVQRWAQ